MAEYIKREDVLRHRRKMSGTDFGDYTAINTNKEKESLVSSWLYEHTIFDLVRIYKTFDWENKCLLFMGW